MEKTKGILAVQCPLAWVSILPHHDGGDRESCQELWILQHLKLQCGACDLCLGCAKANDEHICVGGQ